MNPCYREFHPFCDIHGVVADALKIFCDHHQINRVFSVRFIFRNHPDQCILDSDKGFIYNIIVRCNISGKCQVLSDISIDTVRYHFTGCFCHRSEISKLRTASSVKERNDLCNILCLISDSFHVCDHFEGSGNDTQIFCHRLLLKQELQANGFDLTFHLVNFVTVCFCFSCRFRITVQQRTRNTGNQRFTLRTHFNHFFVQQSKLFIKSASHTITQTFL